MCRYNSFKELSFEKIRGSDFAIHHSDRRSPLIVIAPHGGGIEPGTGEIAQALAGKRHSWYIFDGLREHGNHELHLASTHFDEPYCLELVDHAHTVLAVHGCAGKDEIVYVGGRCARFKHYLIRALNRACFAAHLDGSRHAGSSPRNICNRGSLGMGAQLEVSAGLRRKMFRGLSREGRAEITPVFFKFISAVQAAIDEHQRLGACDLDEKDTEEKNGNPVVWS
jgi:phage replication-related protein YjqB (UPF0714/DUF867 family)